MHYLIDVTNMALVRKHPSRSVLGDLANIECANVATLLAEWHPEFFAKRFTDFELRRLYKSITGEDLKCYFIDGIILAIGRVLEAFPEDDINHLLATAQSKYASDNSDDEDGEPINYRYKPASVVPETLLDLRRPLPRVHATLEAVWLAGLPTTEKLRAPLQPVAGTGAALLSAPTPTPRAPRAPGDAGAVGTRGASSTVVTVADEMWTAAGKPMDPNVVLKLRRDIMAHLETEYGIKRTTSSTALGNWQKARLTP